MTQIRNNQAGFTAVELLVTLFVAAAFLIAGYQLFNIVIKDGGQTRAESRASNEAYNYLRKYSDSATNPCTALTPVTGEPINIDGLANAKVTVAITCPQLDAPSNSKVEVIISYGANSDMNVKFATYTDRSKGANPVSDVTDGLLAQWKLNGNGAPSAGGVEALVFGASPTANRDGQDNMAYGFVGAGQNQYLQVNSTLGLTNVNLSIMAWVYTSSTSTYGQYIRVGDTGGYGIGIGNGTMDNVNPGPEILGIFEGVRWIDTNTALGTGWHHLAMTISSSGVPSIYRDGVLVGTYTGGNAAVPAGNRIRIGGDLARYITGSMDDVRVYARPLSASELVQIVSAGPK